MTSTCTIPGSCSSGIPSPRLTFLAIWRNRWKTTESWKILLRILNWWKLNSQRNARIAIVLLTTCLTWLIILIIHLFTITPINFFCDFLLRRSKIDPTWMMLLPTSIIRFSSSYIFTFDFVLEIGSDKLQCHNYDSGRRYHDLKISFPYILYTFKWWHKMTSIYWSKWFGVTAERHQPKLPALLYIHHIDRAGRRKNSEFPTMNSSKKNGGISEYNW